MCKNAFDLAPWISRLLAIPNAQAAVANLAMAAHRCVRDSCRRLQHVSVYFLPICHVCVLASISVSWQDYPADPLLHACIVCASVSCPDVALTAYTPETLQADMEANMRLFLQNPKKGLSLDKTKKVITLSKVSTAGRIVPHRLSACSS